jgi:hypothetical protein
MQDPGWLGSAEFGAQTALPGHEHFPLIIPPHPFERLLPHSPRLA